MDRITVFDKHADEYDRWFDENEQVYQAEVSDGHGEGAFVVLAATKSRRESRV
ncbi:MAG: hypothetical protein QME66_06810 [Candidatus Eisenbacteria bacterium]|nr:hypothetical protein [Candidatus Eisenbacteria bacterium]